MTSENRERARELYHTVRIVQKRMVRQHHERQREGGPGPAYAELTFPQCNLLMVLRETDQATIRGLAQALQVSPPSASTMVDRLVGLGLLDREQSQQDRREVLVRLSAQGQDQILELEDQVLESILDLLERVGPKYAQQSCEVCRRIREVIEAENNAGAATGETVPETDGQ